MNMKKDMCFSGTKSLESTVPKILQELTRTAPSPVLQCGPRSRRSSHAWGPSAVVWRRSGRVVGGRRERQGFVLWTPSPLSEPKTGKRPSENGKTDNHLEHIYLRSKSMHVNPMVFFSFRSLQLLILIFITPKQSSNEMTGDWCTSVEPSSVIEILRW